MHYPKHIWFIPDWNRTWAKKKWVPSFLWHLEGFNTLVSAAKYLFTHTDLKVFSAWWLSTENKNSRSNEELEYLYNLYEKIPSELESFMIEHKINFKRVGTKEWLPQKLVNFLESKEKDLCFDSDKYIVLAVNYWGRDEICRWVSNLLKDNSNLTCWELLSNFDKNYFEKYLDFFWLPNIDLVIRTKWESAKRLSWFMLWWVWYAELYFTEKLCPEFDHNEIDKALEWFNNIYHERNFGK